MPPPEGQWRQIGYKCPSTYQWPAHLKIWVHKGNLKMIDDENRILCHHLGVSYTRHLRFDLSVKMRNSTILPSFFNIVIFTWKSQREHKERDRPGKPDPPIDLWIIIEFWLMGVYRGRSIGRMIEFKHWAWTYFVNIDLIVAFFQDQILILMMMISRPVDPESKPSNHNPHDGRDHHCHHLLSQINNCHHLLSQINHCHHLNPDWSSLKPDLTFFVIYLYTCFPFQKKFHLSARVLASWCCHITVTWNKHSKWCFTK